MHIHTHTHIHTHPQGIIGNDSRHYALDLFRIFPPDANFLLRPDGAKLRHKMAILRPEMIDTFLRYCTILPSGQGLWHFAKWGNIT